MPAEFGDERGREVGEGGRWRQLSIFFNSSGGAGAGAWELARRLKAPQISVDLNIGSVIFKTHMHAHIFISFYLS
jgi:hypothetical protein